MIDFKFIEYNPRRALRNASASRPAPSPASAGGFGDFDDDIPF